MRDDKCLHILSNKSLLFDDGASATLKAAGSTTKPTSRPRKYTYDHVFDEDATQDEVYQTTTSPLIKDVLRGLSAAVFAYGSTGSGKTHTMLGPNPRRAAQLAPVPAAAAAAGSRSTDEPPPKTQTTGAGNGLMVKAIDEIFRHVEAAPNPDAYRVRSGTDMRVYSIPVDRYVAIQLGRQFPTWSYRQLWAISGRCIACDRVLNDATRQKRSE